MAMARIFLMTFFMFHLILVPSKAYPFQDLFYNRFLPGFDSRNPEEYEGQLPFQDQDQDQDHGGYEKQQPMEQIPPEQNQGGNEQQKPIEQEEPNKGNRNDLKEGFYSQSCPNAEKIVADNLAKIVKTNPGAMANVLRLQFHDCFVGGCDASILLDSVPSGDQVEKSSLFNGIMLKGADIIDDIKGRLEQECPETVSCADTLAFATHHSMIMAGVTPPQGPLGGRRDAMVSLAAIAEANNLPLPNWSVDQMVEVFKRKGFNEEEMVILLGAHSIGSAHCDFFTDRLFNFKDSQKPDPVLTLPIVDELKQICKQQGTPQYRNPPVNFDETPTVLDNLFFRNLVEKKRALLSTDSALLNDPRTAPTVQKMAADVNLFQKRFPELMIRLSSVDVITGNKGEVRKICRSTN